MTEQEKLNLLVRQLQDFMLEKADEDKDVEDMMLPALVFVLAKGFTGVGVKSAALLALQTAAEDVLEEFGIAMEPLNESIN